MKPPAPKPSDLKAVATQTLDLADVDVTSLPSGRPPEEAPDQPREPPVGRRIVPPPLPPGFMASPAPEELAPPSASIPPVSPSFAPPAPRPAPAAAPARTTGFYAVILLVCLGVSVGGGVVIAMSLRKPPSASATPSATSAASPASSAKPTTPRVITISTVEVGNEPDGG